MVLLVIQDETEVDLQLLMIELLHDFIQTSFANSIGLLAV